MATQRRYTSEAQRAADEATYRNAYQATAPAAGRNAAADNFLAGANGYPEYNNSPAEWTNRQMATPSQDFPPSIAQQATLEAMAQRADEAEAEMALSMADPVGVLKSKSIEKNTELSLKTLKKSQKDKILKSFTTCRDIANRQYREIVEPEIKRRRRICEADEDYYNKKFPQLSQMSKYCSKDVKGACQWILPGLMEAFTGTETPLSVKGVNANDDERAAKIQMLLQYQLEKKNKYQPFCHAEIEAALQENWGVAKVWWKREEDRKPMEMLLDITDEPTMTALLGSISAGKVEVTKVTDIEGEPNFLKLNYDEIIVKTNHPVLEFLPSSELRYTPDAPDLQHCRFVAQRKIVRGDYLKRRERDGIYENIDKAIEHYSEGNTYPSDLDRMNDPDRAEVAKRPNDGDNASKEVELYEAYLAVDYNNDGIFENLIVHAVGDTLIRVAVNDFEEPPFYICSAFYDPNAVFSRSSFSDYLEQYQDVKTALIRQVIVNQAKNNTPRVFVNERNVDIESLINGDEVIPVSGDPTNAMAVPPQLPLSQSVFEVLQFAQSELEALSGSTRYSQGLDSNSLNKMLDIYTVVPMADGSTKLLKDIADGDMIVGQSGKPTKVLKAHKIHYPKRAYLMTFSNGDVIKAGGEHLWTIQTQHGKRQTVNTDWIAAYKSKYKGNLYIDKVDAVDFGEKDLPLDPYLLGLWLGNGCLHTNRITTMDQFVVDYVANWAKEQGGYIEEASYQNAGKATTYDIKKTPLRTILRKLHLSRDARYEDMKDNVKHIPEIYFHASFEQRLALLQGLLDTDGCHHSGALCVFCQKGGQLLDDVIRLVKSFGWRVHQHEVFPLHASEGARHYQITFSADYNPFRTPYKSTKWKHVKALSGKVTISAIEETDVCLMRCLTVDAPDGQFCVGEHFTVTHNTASGIHAIMGASDKRNKLIARSIAENFFIPIYKFLIRLNQKYLEDEQMVRLVDQTVSIRKEDLDIDYDLIVNVGQGAGSREQQIQYLIYTLQTVYPALTAQGIVNSKSWYNLVCKLLETLGLRDVSSYLMDPDSQQAQLAAQQAQQAAANQQAQALQAGLQLAIAKSSVPRVSIDLTAMPPEVQVQYLQDKLGIRTTEANIMEHEVIQANE